MGQTAIVTDAAEIMATYKRYWLIRANLGLTDRDVIEKANVPNTSISNWRNGKALPREKTLYKIATTLGVKVSDFFEGG